MVMGRRGEKEMTYWELILPMTATCLILVCPFLSKAVFFCSCPPLPIFLLLLHIPLFIWSLHSLCSFLMHLPIFLIISCFCSSVLSPHSCALTSAQPHADLSSLRLQLCQTPSPLIFPPLESPDLRLSSLSAPGFFPSKFILSQRNGAYRVLQHWWHKVSSTE